MQINKDLDFSGNIKLTLDIQESLKGSLSADTENMLISFNVSEESINEFVQQLNEGIQINVNGRPLKLIKSKDGNTFTAVTPKNIERVEIFVGSKLLADYSIDNSKPILKKENLIDSYFIKNSILNKSINFDDIVEPTQQIKTDLHTHYAGAPTSRGLIELGLEKDFQYPTYLLNQAGINVDQNLKTVSLRSLSESDLKLLEQHMQISVGEQIRFSSDEKNLEKIYSFRQPFFRDYSLTPELLELIAKEYSKNGVSYVELSGSQIFELDKEPQMLKLATETIPNLEEKYGIKLRFLGAMTRYDDVEWSLDQLEKLKLVANNPYIAGLDIVGHETNSTLDIVGNIEPYMVFAKENGLDWTFRFHAGENPSHPENVKEALKLAEKYGVKTRIGHGLYGIDEETLDLAKKTNAIIEINSSSNLSLNNVTDVEEMQPLVFYLKNGINVVLGTDSPGIYQTNSQQELAVAQRILNRNGISPDLLNNIIKTESMVVSERVKEENRLNSIPNSSVIPEPSKFIGLSSHWTPEVERNKSKIREEKFSSKINRINKIGSKYLESYTIKNYLQECGKQPFIVAGGSKNNWKTLTDQEKEKIQVEMVKLLDVLDPNKFVLVTGGTDYGVEEIIHNNAKRKGFSVLGVLTEEIFESEVKNPDISHYTIVAGNWWAKSSFLMDNIIKPCNGKALFVAGGPIVGDEILSSLYHKLDKDQLFLMKDVGGASDKKAKQNPQYAIDHVDEIAERINEHSKQVVLTNIEKVRSEMTNISKDKQVSLTV
jgi:adenosine deaminase